MIEQSAAPLALIVLTVALVLGVYLSVQNHRRVEADRARRARIIQRERARAARKEELT